MPKALDLIRDKLKQLGLDEKDLGSLEEGIQATINEQTESKVKQETEAIKQKYDVIAEEYCNRKIKEGIEEAKSSLVNEYDKKMEMLEEKYVKKLDLFLEQNIIPQVSDETIAKIAEQQVMGPIISKIKAILEEHHISVDSSGSALLKEAKEEIVKLKNQVNTLIEQKMVLEERCVKVAKQMLLTEATEGLDIAEKKRVVEMFADKSFDETKKRVGGFVDFILEARTKTNTSEAKSVRKKIMTESATEGRPAPKKAPASEEDDQKSEEQVLQEAATRYL